MTDVLIPLGQGSRHDNLELRYCLRSIEKHLTGVGNVWIVGERPEWLCNVVHVPCQDNPNNWNRAWNIWRKIMAGINAQTAQITHDIILGQYHEPVVLSDNFLFMNDDHFLLSNSWADTFPCYHRGSIDTLFMRDNIPQYKQMYNTLEVLKKEMPGRQHNDFDVHCPMRMHKGLFKKVFEKFTKWPEYGYGIKSMYGNLSYEARTQEIDDLKFREPLMAESIYRVLEDRPWFSIGDRCLKSGDMKRVLSELYPNKSKWEL